MREPLPWLIYGATGVTGRLVVAEALRRGHRPTLAARSDSVRELAKQHQLSAEIVALDDRPVLEALLRRSSRVIHVAGPFSRTAKPMIDACLATGTPYADMNGEVDAMEATLARDAEARRAGIPLVAAAGFGVAVGDCLALHVARLQPGANRLLLGVHSENQHQSAGAAMSTLNVIGQGGAWVENGALVHGGMAHRAFRGQVFGRTLTFVAAPLAEALAAHHSTRIAEVIAGVPMSRIGAQMLRGLGPTVQRVVRAPRVRRWLERRIQGRAAQGSTPPVGGHRSYVWAEARGGEGTTRAVLEVGEGYSFAAAVAVRAAEQLPGLTGGGAFTPGSAFGADFVLQLEGARRDDLEPESSQ